MTGTRAALRWGTPASLALVAGLGGLLVFGLLGALVGVLAGPAAARDPRRVLLAAGVALLITAALTMVEQPLELSGIIDFPHRHGAANVAGAIAAVLLLAGLAGLFAQPEMRATRRLGRGVVHGPSRVPTSTLAALLGATLLGCLALSQFGDRDWGAAPLVLAILVLILGMALVTWRVVPGVRGGRGDA